MREESHTHIHRTRWPLTFPTRRLSKSRSCSSQGATPSLGERTALTPQPGSMSFARVADFHCSDVSKHLARTELAECRMLHCSLASGLMRQEFGGTQALVIQGSEVVLSFPLSSPTKGGPHKRVRMRSCTTQRTRCVYYKTSRMDRLTIEHSLFKHGRWLWQKQKTRCPRVHLDLLDDLIIY